MQPWLAATALKALKMTSTIRCDVSTLPAHTAASTDGLRSEFSGMKT